MHKCQSQNAALTCAPGSKQMFWKPSARSLVHRPIQAQTPSDPVHFLPTEVACYAVIASQWKAAIMYRLRREISFAFQTSFPKIRVSFDEIKLQFQLLIQGKGRSLHNSLFSRAVPFLSQLPTQSRDLTKLCLTVTYLWLVSVAQRHLLAWFLKHGIIWKY